MGCSTCSKCKWIRNSAFCGTTKLTEKQLYAKNGFCSTYEQKEEAQGGKADWERFDAGLALLKEQKDSEIKGTIEETRSE